MRTSQPPGDQNEGRADSRTNCFLIGAGRGAAGRVVTTQVGAHMLAERPARPASSSTAGVAAFTWGTAEVGAHILAESPARPASSSTMTATFTRGTNAGAETSREAAGGGAMIRTGQPPRAHANVSGLLGSHCSLGACSVERAISWVAGITAVGRIVGTNAGTEGLSWGTFTEEAWTETDGSRVAVSTGTAGGINAVTSGLNWQ
ncbi:hypothetical protein B0H17DRAFT_1056147, partial [Mycena rosella]